MSRTPRQESTDAAHHVTARCLDGRVIARHAGDVDELLGRLGDEAGKRGWSIGTYCVMPNHYHMVLWTPQGDLGRGMKLVQEGFAHHANHRDEKRGRGHFWSERFHSVPMRTREQVLARLRYDARNPVKHGFTERPEDWPHSAHLALLGLREAPPWLAVDRALALAGGREAYRAIVERDDRSLVHALLRQLDEPEALRRAVDDHDVPIAVLADVLGCSRPSVYRRLGPRETEVTVPFVSV